MGGLGKMNLLIQRAGPDTGRRGAPRLAVGVSARHACAAAQLLSLRGDHEVTVRVPSSPVLQTACPLATPASTRCCCQTTTAGRS